MEILTNSSRKSMDLRRFHVNFFSCFQQSSISETFRNFPKHLRPSFYSNSLYSKPILIILDVLKSFNVPLSDSVMTETCSRQTTACSRQTCSSCDKSTYLVYKINLL